MCKSIIWKELNQFSCLKKKTTITVYSFRASGTLHYLLLHINFSSINVVYVKFSTKGIIIWAILNAPRNQWALYFLKYFDKRLFFPWFGCIILLFFLFFFFLIYFLFIRQLFFIIIKKVYNSYFKIIYFSIYLTSSIGMYLAKVPQTKSPRYDSLA